MFLVYFPSRRQDRQPAKHSRVCSCHFRNGNKSAGPEIYTRNEEKLFPSDGCPPKKKKKESVKESNDLQSMIKRIREEQDESQNMPASREAVPSAQVILEAEVDHLSRELTEREQTEHYQRNRYSVSAISPEVIRMETGLPTKEVFDIFVKYTQRFQGSINYFFGWKVTSISFEDQIFITLMKLRQNYTNLHLGQLFSCSETTIANIVTTFVHVLHIIFFDDLMTTIPSRDKNKIGAPSSFSNFTTCRIVIDCTDIEIAAPGLMSQQNATYSSYRGMNSFKVIVGVAPNAVITYVSKLYPGSISDKAIVQQSGLLKQFVAGDLILADKGFLIQGIVPSGVSVNIPPFLNNGKFTESEVKATKSIARCRIHVERANARLKDFKILNFIPSYLRCYVDQLFQLCAVLVNLQFPLIKEGCEGTAGFD